MLRGLFAAGAAACGLRAGAGLVAGLGAATAGFGFTDGSSMLMAATMPTAGAREGFNAARCLTGLIDRALPGMLVAYRITSSFKR